MEHAHDFDGSVVDAVENDVRLHHRGPKAAHDLVARSPSERIVRETSRCRVNLAQQLVSDFD